MTEVDVVVIGSGILGCFAARNLTRWQLSVLLIEEKEDVCLGITKANMAVIYPGYDNKPGSLKAKMTVRANKNMGALCRELEVPFHRTGSLMVSFGRRSEQVLRKKYDQGQRNNVPGLKLLTGEEARALEPLLTPEITGALYAPSTGTVNPWQLGIAAYENARQNGCEALFSAKVTRMQQTRQGYLVETEKETIACKVVLNCTGAAADTTQELLFPPSVRLVLDGTDFFVMERQMETPHHIIFQELEEKGKGITAVPTVDGNLLLGSARRPIKGASYATDVESLVELRRQTKALFPTLNENQGIRSFGALRPNPYQVFMENGKTMLYHKSIDSFVIENPGPGFWSLIGIKTPGLTCAQELGAYLAEHTAAYLKAVPNGNFDGRRKGILRVSSLGVEVWRTLVEKEPAYGEVVCQCEGITKGEILEAIRRGAVTLDGVKHRVGTGMGTCQGSRCRRRILELLEEGKYETG